MAKEKKKVTPTKAPPKAKKAVKKDVVVEKAKVTKPEKASKHAFPAKECVHETTRKQRNHRNVMITVCIDCGKQV